MFRPAAAALIVGASVAALGLLGWQATRSDDAAFLAREAPAEWILYPGVPGFGVRARATLSATFTKSFELAAKPETARLRVRMHRTGELLVNGRAVPLQGGDGRRWKQAREGDVASLLRAGPNTLQATVSAEAGPPALWLALELDGERITSDESWTSSLMGAEDAPARLARVPMSRWPRSAPDPEVAALHNPRPLDALAARAPGLTGLFALGAVVAGAGALGLRRASSLSPRAAFVAWLGVAAAWLALFANNRGIHGAWGFDVTAHHDYILRILQDGHLPLADEGFQMYQPPLYYLLSAGLLKLAGFATIDDESVQWLRALGFAAALLQAGFLLLALRELLPDRPCLVLCAFAFGAFLPASIYMTHATTNENWVAALSSGALWWTIRMLRRDEPRRADYAVLGAFLGLAMLAKFSALVPLVLCLGVLLVQRCRAGQRSAAALLPRFGLALAVVLAICGWHYTRVALHFDGNPFVGNWDPRTRYIWWQDPGYHVFEDYARFGAALVRPLMSATASVPDALYSTFFGDGLNSGSGFPHVTPPWNLDWMAAGYALALLPCAALLLGVLLTLADFARAPRAERFLAISVLGATLFLLLSLTLRLPYYAQAKAFYGLSALVPLAFCFALGFDALALRWRALAPLGVAWLVCWACVSWLSFFTTPERRAENPMTAVTKLDPGGFLARSNEAVARGAHDEAIEALRRSLAIDPDQREVGGVLARLLRAEGRTEEALAAARAALRVEVTNADLHRLTAELWAERRAPRRAQFHLEAAERFARLQTDR
jgi:tetratricopeptide (TPR) repeat protein